MVEKRDLDTNLIWRPPTLSELTSYQMQLDLTHLGAEGSMYFIFTIDYTEYVLTL